MYKFVKFENGELVLIKFDPVITNTSIEYISDGDAYYKVADSRLPIPENYTIVNLDELCTVVGNVFNDISGFESNIHLGKIINLHDVRNDRVTNLPRLSLTFINSKSNCKFTTILYMRRDGLFVNDNELLFNIKPESTQNDTFTILVAIIVNYFLYGMSFITKAGHRINNTVFPAIQHVLLKYYIQNEYPRLYNEDFIVVPADWVSWISPITSAKWAYIPKSTGIAHCIKCVIAYHQFGTVKSNLDINTCVNYPLVSQYRTRVDLENDIRNFKQDKFITKLFVDGSDILQMIEAYKP